MDDVISPKLRRLAIVTGCLVAITGLLQWTNPIPACFLILGAAIQPRSHRPGRWLMWVSALMMTAWSFPLGILAIPEMMRVFTPPAVAILLAIALMLWCDVELVSEAVVRLRHKAPQVPPHPGNLDWIAWIAAFALSGYYLVLSVFAVVIRPQVGLFMLVLSVGFAAVMIVFDLALIRYWSNTHAPNNCGS